MLTGALLLETNSLKFASSVMPVAAVPNDAMPCC